MYADITRRFVAMMSAFNIPVCVVLVCCLYNDISYTFPGNVSITIYAYQSQTEQCNPRAYDHLTLGMNIVIL